MEKLKFWLDELDLIAKEFNREYEQLCKEHLTRLQNLIIDGKRIKAFHSKRNYEK